MESFEILVCVKQHSCTSLFMAIFQDIPGKQVPEYHCSGFYWNKDDGDVPFSALTLLVG